MRKGARRNSTKHDRDLGQQWLRANNGLSQQGASCTQTQQGAQYDDVTHERKPTQHATQTCHECEDMGGHNRSVQTLCTRFTHHAQASPIRSQPQTVARSFAPHGPADVCQGRLQNKASPWSGNSCMAESRWSDTHPLTPWRESRALWATSLPQMRPRGNELTCPAPGCASPMAHNRASKPGPLKRCSKRCRHPPAERRPRWGTSPMLIHGTRCAFAITSV